MSQFEIHLFGATTPAGEAFLRSCNLSPHFGPIFCYSRSRLSGFGEFRYLDLENPSSFDPGGELNAPKIWISFSPIWIFAPFLNSIAANSPELLSGLGGLIACSSSSVITKRFSFNGFDRNLVSSLIKAEDELINTSFRLSFPCKVVRPSLIYGRVGEYGDSNLTILLHQLRRFPLIPLPSITGLRQPIHASQLAAVFLRFAEQLNDYDWDSSFSARISIGGDCTLTYFAMLRALQMAQPSGDPARRCHLLSIPNRLFFLLAAPLLIISPKYYEAVLRMGANLSGFTPSHKVLGSAAESFPVLPLT
ncbi:hypothetical protein SynWH8101_0246 [Synechococcus sp. WH 8101]|uniref:hypothetical protein n=1 Tax=Synechococcus sp. WH 8101 TaxID=59932 RepID=UPI0010232CAF|nr:hypothetical protein [Synechococcus sp. WH 8101]QBE67858.1 hypothetical protein SynWH8101_0246 [Synechococcus sp. WH 8101]